MPFIKYVNQAGLETMFNVAAIRSYSASEERGQTVLQFILIVDGGGTTMKMIGADAEEALRILQSA